MVFLRYNLPLLRILIFVIILIVGGDIIRNVALRRSKRVWHRIRLIIVVNEFPIIMVIGLTWFRLTVWLRMGWILADLNFECWPTWR